MSRHRRSTFMDRYLHDSWMGYAVLSLCLAWISLTMTYGTLPPCPTEDSVHCYWDATTQGNGHGTSVVNP